MLSIRVSGTSCVCSGFAASVNGLYSYKQQRFPYSAGSGYFNATFNDSMVRSWRVHRHDVQIDTLASVFPGNDTNGHPYVIMKSQTTLNNFALTLHGSMADWLVNLFVKIMNKQIAQQIQDSIDDQVESMGVNITSQIANISIPLPMNITNITGFGLDWSIDNVNYITNSTINRTIVFESKGLLLFKDDVYHGQPSPLPQDFTMTMVRRDMLVMASNASVQSVFHALYLGDVLQVSSNCTTRDFKYILPCMYVKFPDAVMTITYRPVTEPISTISGQYIYVKCIVRGIGIVLVNGTHDTVVLDMHEAVHVNMSLRFKGSRMQNLTGHIDDMTMKVINATSPFGRLNVDLLNVVIKLFTPVIEGILNERMSNGYQMPSLSAFNTTIDVVNGRVYNGRDFVSIGLDIEPAI